MKHKIAFLLMTAAWLRAEYTTHKNYKIILHEADVILFLGTKLDQAGVKFDEFDKIVMENFAKTKP